MWEDELKRYVKEKGISDRLAILNAKDWYIFQDMHEYVNKSIDAEYKKDFEAKEKYEAKAKEMWSLIEEIRDERNRLYEKKRR